MTAGDRLISYCAAACSASFLAGLVSDRPDSPIISLLAMIFFVVTGVPFSKEIFYRNNLTSHAKFWLCACFFGLFFVGAVIKMIW